MPYKVIRNCSDGVIGHLHRPGDIIDGHPQIETLLAKGTVRELDPEPEAVEVEETFEEPEVKRGRGRPKKVDPVEGESDSGDEHSGEPDPLESE